MNSQNGRSKDVSLLLQLSYLLSKEETYQDPQWLPETTCIKLILWHFLCIHAYNNVGPIN